MSRNVPKLRFKGFEDEWRKGKLGDMSKIIMGQSPSSNAYNYNKEGLPLVQGNADITKRITTPRMYTTEITKTCEIEDIIMSVRAPVGSIAIAKQRSCIGRGVCSIKAIGINQKYLYQVLLGYEKKWLKISQGSTFESINSNDIKGVMLNIPSLQEQEKIANFLSKVDSIIEKQEKKVQYWNSYKKGMMQKIFSQKIRFKDENGRNYPEWEERALKKIIIEDLYPVNKPNVAYEKLSVRSHAKGTFSSRVDDPATVAMDTLYEVKENQLIVNITFAWEHAIAIVKKEDEGKLVSHRFPTYKFNPDCYYKFYEYVIKQSSLKYKLGLASPGGAGRNRVLNKKEFLKIEVQHPCFEEQVKIANFLSNIDNIIEKESKKLEELKQWKKGLLQQMFV
ncbi:restriction endonuclease subunit S [Clostridium perfringens]|nr:restriction endonuclease subunit S [Clostridium perfringens]